MGREIHYEVFKRVGARGGWTLHDVRSDRDISLSLAKELMATDQATGVKVVKETYNDDTGDYLTLKIFEDGHNQMKIEPAQEEAPNAIPCFKPDDLYSYHARATMRRLLVDYLSRNKITITELIHRAGAADRQEPERTHHPGCQSRLSRPACRQVSQSGVSPVRPAGAATLWPGRRRLSLQRGAGAASQGGIGLGREGPDAAADHGAGAKRRRSAQADSVVGGCDPGGDPQWFGGAARTLG